MRLHAALVAVGLLVLAVASVGLGARATYGARTTADEPQYLLTALSIYEDGDLDIANQRYSGEYRVFHEATLPVQSDLRADGSRLSPHNPLLPLLLAVPMGLGGWVAAKLAMALMAGILASLMVWAGVRRFGLPVGLASLVVVVFAASPPLAVYATQIYPELPAALAVTIAVTALTGPPSRPSALAWLLGVIALPWLAVKYVPVAGVLAVAGIWRHRHTTPPVLVVAVLLIASIGYVGFNSSVYGGLTPYAAGDHLQLGVGEGPAHLGEPGLRADGVHA